MREKKLPPGFALQSKIAFRIVSTNVPEARIFPRVLEIAFLAAFLRERKRELPGKNFALD